jgi:hypothetical protein
MLHETFIPLSLKGDGTSCLYRIVHAGGQLFEIDEVEEDNFVVFTPLRRPHSQHGNNFAKRIVPTQNARTVLMRGILDHTTTTTNPRWQVLNGTLANPKELLDNRLRGIVNVKQREGIMPLQYPNLNPFVYQTIEMLKGSKEETTGISSLSQGLNKDAISSQNSQGLVNDLITVSQTRQKIIARNFANFVSALFLKARKLVLENESKKKLFEFDNDFQKIDPKLWTPSRDGSGLSPCWLRRAGEGSGQVRSPVGYADEGPSRLHVLPAREAIRAAPRRHEEERLREPRRLHHHS